MRLLLLVLLFTIGQIHATTLSAKTWLIADADGNIIEKENIDVIQPIASITKLMTAIVYLDSNENLDEPLKTRFRGMIVTRRQLLDLSIVHSDNKAADMLCKIYRLGYKGCIEEMNRKSLILGMNNTAFYDATGLDNRNVSTATDLIKLLLAAEKYSVIVNASNRTVVELVKKQKRNKTIKQKFSNTNPLVAKYNVLVSKTGYVRASGGCLVMSANIAGKKKLFVVLNSRTTRTRIHDMEALILSHLNQN